jgi:hypothetical protein
MKVELSFEFGEDHKGMGEEEKKPMELTPFQKKVAKMLAQKAGRSKPNDEDLYKASELEDEED